MRHLFPRTLPLLCCSYDGNYFSLFPQNALPLVGVVINDVLVEQVAAGGYNSSAYYTDFVAFSTPNEDLEEFSGEGADGNSAAQHSIQVCLASVTGAPYLNTLQILPMVRTASAYWHLTAVALGCPSCYSSVMTGLLRSYREELLFVEKTLAM